jgi:hypothetical protein
MKSAHSKRSAALLDQKNDSLEADQPKWEEGRRQLARSRWNVLEPVSLSAASGATLKVLEDQSALASGTNADNETYEITLRATPREVTAVRLEALTHDSLPLKGASRGTNGNFILTSFEAQAESADPAKEPPVTAGVEWGKVLGSGHSRPGRQRKLFKPLHH